MRANAGETFWGDPITCTSIGTSIVFQDTTATFAPNVLTLFAPTVVVAWKSSDIARWRDSSASSSPSASLSIPTSNVESGFSAGAKAGIGVGCALVVIAIAAIFLVFRRKRNERRRLAGDDAAVTYENGKPVAEAKEHVELADEAALQEMGHGQREPDNVNARAELM
jgi:hypothetical protein